MVMFYKYLLFHILQDVKKIDFGPFSFNTQGEPKRNNDELEVVAKTAAHVRIVNLMPVQMFQI